MPPAPPPLDITYTLPSIAPCEHIAGSEKFARKAMEIQLKHLRPNGRSFVDITLDLEDGAPIGQELSLRETFISILESEENQLKQIGVRVHATTSPHFESDIESIVSRAGNSVSYITIPKITSLRDVRWVSGLIQTYLSRIGSARTIPLHLLIETPEAFSALREIAAHPAVESLDFGIMDYISHHGGAIPSTAMRSPEQFTHPLIQRAKCELANAALAHNKVPNHNVSVDVKNPEQAYLDAYKARHEFGFLRMWSIHPDQIPHIIKGMTPTTQELDEAKAIIAAAQAAQWGPIERGGRLHDRASFRYYWGLLSQNTSL